MFEYSEFWKYFSLMFLLTAIPVAFMIILEKRSPYKTAAWILVLILMPIFGVIFYLIFGHEYRKQKLFSRRGIKSLGQFRRLANKQLREFDKSHHKLNPEILSKENLIRLLLNNSNSLLTTGNELKLLKSGEETFTAIFDAIKKAEHHIHLEYYIFANDKIGGRLKDLLIKKSNEGVEVRIIIDDVGSWGLKRSFFNELKQNRIEIFPFMEVRFPRLTSKVNFRNHRKILIVDGKIGFTGGVNVADRYAGGHPKLGAWHDTHLQIEGDAVACLQVVFAADWFCVINENLTGGKYFPVFSENPGVPVQISASGPDSDWENIGQVLFAAIANSRQKVYIATPYLMPPQSLTTALKTAALSNVDVKIIIPRKSDSIITKWSSFSYIEELLEAGVKVYLFEDGFIHSKYMMVDNLFSSLGTANFDFRSMETNFEVNAFIYDKRFSLKLEKHFLQDMKMCEEIKYVKWKERPWHFKFREALAHIVSPLL